MARFYGSVGYSEGTVEVRPGVHKEVIVEKNARGDLLRITQTAQSGRSVNNDISVNHSISILADAYANEHLSGIRYVKWSGELWKVDSIETQYPRLILSLGGVYNGKTPSTP